MDLRQEVFDHVLRQDAHFFENQTTGRIMSSIMNDIDKIQVAVSTMLADWLRQIFTLIALLLAMITIDWRLSLISLIVFPVVAGLTAKLGKTIRRTTRYAQDTRGGSEPDSAGVDHRAQRGEELRRGRFRIEPLPCWSTQNCDRAICDTSRSRRWRRRSSNSSAP